MFSVNTLIAALSMFNGTNRSSVSPKLVILMGLPVMAV